MWRFKREDIPGVPDAVRVSVELVEHTPAAPVSPEALAAADTGPMPLTDTAVIAQLRQQIAIRDDQISGLRRLIKAKDDYITTLQNEGGELRVRLRESARRADGDTVDAVRADRDALDAANGSLVERIRRLEKQLAAARRAPLDTEAGA